jgi:hypothetical protein
LSQKPVQEAIQLAIITGAKLATLDVYQGFFGSPYGTLESSEDVTAEAQTRQHNT